MFGSLEHKSLFRTFKSLVLVDLNFGPKRIFKFQNNPFSNLKDTSLFLRLIWMFRNIHIA
jgi:hypothetical protein